MPVPLAPEVIDTQPALSVAVQEQPEGAVTVAVRVPPLNSTESDDADTLKVHVMPAWVIVCVSPAIVSVPFLDDCPLLAATV